MEENKQVTDKAMSDAINMIAAGCNAFVGGVSVAAVLEARNQLEYLSKRIGRSRIAELIPWTFKVDIEGEGQYDDDGGTYMSYSSQIKFTVPEFMTAIVGADNMPDDREILVCLDVGDFDSLDMEPVDQALLIVGMSLVPPNKEGFEMALNPCEDLCKQFEERMSEMSMCLGAIAVGDSCEITFND